MREDTSVAQRVYEFVVRADREVRTREIVAGVGANSVSAVTYALTRLVREGNLERIGYARYRIPTGAGQDVLAEDGALDARLARIFEAIRPVIHFEDLAFLYRVVLMARRLAPDLFKAESQTNTL
jgi:predicted transcriptional regulator of viral defense system